MSDDLIAHYQALLKEHGASAEAVHWADRDTQYARFRILSEISDSLGSVLDFGCGLGDLYHFLRAEGFDGRYCGVDIVPEFVEIAAAINPPMGKAVLDKDGGELPGGHDFAFLSGVFNNKMPDNQTFMETTLRRMWAAAEKGIAFNAMTTWVDYQDPELWYVDPGDVLKFCKSELGGHVTLRHDYVLRDGGFPFEFAVYVYKDPKPSSAS